MTDHTHTMRTLAIANHKGGTGKTTTAVNLAACLAERGKRVVLLDLDPQGQASAWLGVSGPSVLEALEGRAKLADLVKAAPKLPGVSVIPGGLALAGAERSLAQEAGPELLLRRTIGKLPADYLLVDCRPGVGLLSVNALAAAHALLVPVEAHPLSLNALAGFLDAVGVIVRELNPGLRLAGILPVRVRGYTRLAQDTLAAMRKRYGRDVLAVTIREATKVAEAPSHGRPLTSYARRHEVTAEYRKLAALMIEDGGNRRWRNTKH